MKLRSNGRLSEVPSTPSTHDFQSHRVAFIRSLEIIGEAAVKVGPAFRAQHPAIEWRAMTGMRNRLIHEYFGVDHDLDTA